MSGFTAVLGKCWTWVKAEDKPRCPDLDWNPLSQTARVTNSQAAKSLISEGLSTNRGFELIYLQIWTGDVCNCILCAACISFSYPQPFCTRENSRIYQTSLSGEKTNQLSGTPAFLRAEPLVIYKSSLDNSHHPSMLDEYCSMVQYEPHSKLPPCNDCKLLREGKAARDERFVVRGNAAWRSWKQ